MANETKNATAPKTDDKKAEPKAEPKVKKAPELPNIESFTGPSKEQMESVLRSAKQFIGNFKAATAVDTGALRDVRRAVYSVVTDSLKSRKVDPKVRKRERLLKQIEKAQEALKDLGA